MLFLELLEELEMLPLVLLVDLELLTDGVEFLLDLELVTAGVVLLVLVRLEAAGVLFELLREVTVFVLRLVDLLLESTFEERLVLVVALLVLLLVLRDVTLLSDLLLLRDVTLLSLRLDVLLVALLSRLDLVIPRSFLETVLRPLDIASRSLRASLVAIARPLSPRRPLSKLR